MSLPDQLTLADFADVLADPIILVDKAGNVLYRNVRAESILPAATPDSNLNIVKVFEEPDNKVLDYLKMCGRNLQPIPGKFSIVRPNGSTDTFLVRGARVVHDDVDVICLDLHDKSKAGESERFRSLNENVEKLQLEVKARKHVEAVLEAEKQTLACVISGQPLTTALQLLVSSLENQAEGMLVSILLLDETGRLRHCAANSLPRDYCEAIDGLEIGPDVGSCGNAAHTGLTTIAVDVMSDPRWEPFRELAAKAGVRSCWSTPIISSKGHILGTLAMYYRVPREPSDDELRLIANSAYVASIVIDRYRAQEELDRLLDQEKNLREAAERENKAKDEFLAMLGHELRNPLSAIANAAFALEARAGEDEIINKLYGIVVNETALLKRILDDLLDISRLSRGKLKLHREPMQLDEFVDELKTAMCSAYPDRPIDFEVTGDLDVINADASRLRQSVQNLLDNAIKYSAAGDEVRFKLTTDENDITMEVSDAGRGIAPEILPTIFEPFVQADKSLDRSESGLGLGLALVKQFTEMHGGHINVRSEGCGQGSTFTLVFPRSALALTDDVGEPVTNAVKAPSVARKVLVVEDNTNAREGLCQLLEVWGHEVVSAADGEQALEVFRKSRPDVALVDIGLPRIDGYEVATTVRSDAAYNEVKLIALTGYGQDSDRQKAIEAGFDSHIVKPANIKDLIAILGEPNPGGSASRA